MPKVCADFRNVHGTVQIYCPGCEHPHSIRVAEPQRWTWNGDTEAPTFSPSLLCTDDGSARCHSFIRDGRIEFLADSTHKLAGQTVDLPEFHWGD